MPSTSSQLSTDQLRQAVQLSEQIERLQQQLNSVLGGSGSATTSAERVPAKGKAGKKGGRKLSAEARARIAAAARARWAKQRKGQGQRQTKGRGQAGTSTTSSKAIALPKKKGGLTPEGRARLAAAMRARWTQSRKSGSAPNTSAKAQA